jgi:hypothetical protein
MQPSSAARSGLVAFLLLLAACNPVVGNRTSAKAEPEGNGLATGPAAQPVPAPAESDNQLTEADGDALVPGTGFNATATIRCVTRTGRAPRDCNAGVVRNRDGSAVVTIFSTEGQSRAISFDAHRQVSRVEAPESAGPAGPRFEARHSGRTTIVTLGGERYDIPDVMVTGD